jgi:hypothetical protein
LSEKQELTIVMKNPLRAHLSRRVASWRAEVRVCGYLCVLSLYVACFDKAAVLLAK